VSERRDLRVLLVEDEAIIAIMLEDMLVDLGCEVVGPVASFAEAIQLARSEVLAGAFLDVHLGGESIYPVADLLAARDIPFVFVSGYGRAGIEARYSGAIVLSKPILDADLERAVAALRRQARSGAGSER
jgi:CheY-like chemotaxis protein